MIKYIIFFSCFTFVNAQNLLLGTIYGDNLDNPLPGANVYWLDNNIGTVTDIEGRFSIQIQDTSNKLIISYVGYISDTLTIREIEKVIHVLEAKDSEDLDEVIVSQRKKSSQLSFLAIQNV